MADMATCEIAPLSGRSFSRTAIVCGMASGTPESLIFSLISCSLRLRRQLVRMPLTACACDKK